MALMRSVRIEGFRRFKKLTLGNLTRVNLLVGDNNVGKTSALEAIEFLASGGSPLRIFAGLHRRGAKLDTSNPDDENVLDAQQLFFGRNMAPLAGPGTELNLSITSDDTGDVAGIRVLGAEKSPVASTLAFFWKGTAQSHFGLLGGRGLSPGNEVNAQNLERASGSASAQFLASGVPTAQELHWLWSAFTGTPTEDRVEDALKLVDPRIKRITFPGSNLAIASYGGVFLRLGDERIALSEFGEGTKRLVALACYLGACAGGTLLVDELAEGLYFERIEAVLRYLAEASEALDVQVFATTHSKDCIDALARLNEREPELATRISVHRIEADRKETIDMDAGKVEFLLEGGQEPR